MTYTQNISKREIKPSYWNDKINELHLNTNIDYVINVI